MTASDTLSERLYHMAQELSLRHLNPDNCAAEVNLLREAAARIKALETVLFDARNEIIWLRKLALYAGTYLAAAASAYEKFVGRHDRHGMKDALFETRYSDFKKAVEKIHTALGHTNPETQGDPT